MTDEERITKLRAALATAIDMLILLEPHGPSRGLHVIGQHLIRRLGEILLETDPRRTKRTEAG